MYFMKYINNILNLNLNLNFNLNSHSDPLTIKNHMNNITNNNVTIVSDIETGNFDIDENYDIESCVYKNISNYISMLNENNIN